MKNRHSAPFRPRAVRIATFAAVVLLAAGAQAKTLVFCSEGSPESSAPSRTNEIAGILAMKQSFSGM